MSDKMGKRKCVTVIISLFIFFLYQSLELSLMDALELAFGNESVFMAHNFPDILGLKYVYYQDTKFQKYYLAAKSGFICTWPLLIIFLFISTPKGP